MASYEDSQVYKLAKRLAVEVHKMTLEELPKFEMYEEGSQIRRSSKSVVETYVEGYGRRYYKAEYIKFLTYSLASNEETKVHLELLHETESLTPDRFRYFYPQYRKLGAMLYNLRKALIEGRAT
ncbi:four helix bundle protein [candidate division KSB3 bacterium]|uniref:Four helix bundle protein n=1 Tax=candidate division KSB3 bacterium TaxID=2044937 RepID=A0A9D5JVU6_9BACT|nr:four helix bundle protein [candidate division KSB3 bacterium]MBD3324891.1 four helix bundle protein [candidate division KSB3 bacterium]